MRVFRRNIPRAVAALLLDALERRALARFAAALVHGDPMWSRRRLFGALAVQVGRGLVRSRSCRLVARAARGDEAAQIELLAWALGIPAILTTPWWVWQLVDRIGPG